MLPKRTSHAVIILPLLQDRRLRLKLVVNCISVWERLAKVQDRSKCSLPNSHHHSMLRRTARTFLCSYLLQCVVVLPDLPFLVKVLHLHSHKQGRAQEVGAQ